MQRTETLDYLLRVEVRKVNASKSYFRAYYVEVNMNLKFKLVKKSDLEFNDKKV